MFSVQPAGPGRSLSEPPTRSPGGLPAPHTVVTDARVFRFVFEPLGGLKPAVLCPEHASECTGGFARADSRLATHPQSAPFGSLGWPKNRHASRLDTARGKPAVSVPLCVARRFSLIPISRRIVNQLTSCTGQRALRPARGASAFHSTWRVFQAKDEVLEKKFFAQGHKAREWQSGGKNSQPPSPP